MALKESRQPAADRDTKQGVVKSVSEVCTLKGGDLGEVEDIRCTAVKSDSEVSSKWPSFCLRYAHQT